LNLTADIYDILVSDSSIDLKWFCVNCEMEVTSSKVSTYQDASCRMDEMMSHIHSLTEKTDNLGRLLEEHRTSRIYHRKIDAGIGGCEGGSN
jgi:hypothetical protein